MTDSSESTDLNPHKQLLVEAAAEIRADQKAREDARPQNLGEGTLRLVGNTLGGVAVGTAAVIMGPYQGFKESGPKGIVGGALGGLAVGVASTTIGIGSGIAQFAQGASRTASKINPPKRDPRLVVSEEDNGEADRSISSEAPPSIKEVYLDERIRLYGDLMNEHSAESAAASMDGLSAPVEDQLYQVLNISPDATPAQIRKAYYRMAQRYHPDKHPDDPEATSKFQEVGQAYQYVSFACTSCTFQRLFPDAQRTSPIESS